MNCEYVKQNAVLLVYDELADDNKHEIERHLERCKDCATEVKALRGLQSVMAASPQLEPTPNLLASSRIRLQEGLETTEQRRGWHRFTFDFAGMLQQMKLSPALAMALLIVGFAGGSLTTYRIARAGSGVVNKQGGEATQASIGGIRSINQEPGTNKVDIKYDRVLSEEAHGSLDDPKIQQLLLYAAHNNLSSGVRLDSFDLLTRSKSDDQNVREALIYGLRYDTNPGVRLKAIDALKPYVKADTRVRDAVLEALINDASPGVRTEAILSIDSVKADSSVRRVLQDLAQRDPSPYIKRKAQEMLNATPEID
jgi:HEAT repeats